MVEEIKHDRRKSDSFDTKKAYKALNFQKIVDNERRADNLEKLVEIREQRKVYFTVLGLCIALNLFFVSLGIIGLFK